MIVLPNDLTWAEHRVMRVYTQTENDTYVKVGLALGLSEQTVKNHVSHILHKLGVTSITRAALIYDRWYRSQSWPHTDRRMTEDRRHHERRSGRDRRRNIDR